MLIGYNLGAHGRFLQKLSCKILRLFGFGNHDYDDHNSTKGNISLNELTELSNKHRVVQLTRSDENVKYSTLNTKVRKSAEVFKYAKDDSQISDLTCDSAIDLSGCASTQTEDEFDEQLIELLYNDLYHDFYGKGDLSDIRENEDPQKRFRTHTVDRIDQVLHQIDDIKKSIVEIDDELYHISGSTYANFNPNFLKLTNTFVDEFERDVDELSDYNIQNRNSITKMPFEELNHKPMEQMKRNISSHDSCKQKGRHFNCDRENSKESYSSFSDVESVQLEWDFDFESGNGYYDSGKQNLLGLDNIEQKQSPLKQKLSFMANGLDMPMTDEQKLKNMHDLLDEAKKLGLLNNIIEALAPHQNNDDG